MGMSLFITLSSPIRMLAGFFRTAVTNAGSAHRVDEFIYNTEGVIQNTQADSVNFDDVAPVFASRASSTVRQKDLKLTTEGVEFAYPGSTKMVLQSISLQLRAGEFAAIVGESGC